MLHVVLRQAIGDARGEFGIVGIELNCHQPATVDRINIEPVFKPLEDPLIDFSIGTTRPGGKHLPRGCFLFFAPGPPLWRIELPKRVQSEMVNDAARQALTAKDAVLRSQVSIGDAVKLVELLNGRNVWIFFLNL